MTQTNSNLPNNTCISARQQMAGESGGGGVFVGSNGSRREPHPGAVVLTVELSVEADRSRDLADDLVDLVSMIWWRALVLEAFSAPAQPAVSRLTTMIPQSTDANRPRKG